MNIFPSILETNIDDFEKQITSLTSFFDYVQIDIVDGIFVPHETVQIEDISHLITNCELRMTNSCEFHLMVNDYESEIKKLSNLNNLLNIKKILIHLSAIGNKSIEELGGTLEKVPDSAQFTSTGGKGEAGQNLVPHISNIELGVVLNPEDDVKSNYEFLSHFNTIQLMTVHPGFQGLPFLPESLEKINELRDLGYKGLITLDGGLNDETVKIIMKNRYLPDTLFPGSYLKEDTAERLNILKKLTEMTNV